MDYRYQLEVVAEDGHSLKRVVISPDWAAALAWVHFEGIRAGRLPAVTVRGASRVEPIWDERSGPPVVAAFEAIVRGDEGEETARRIPRTYVREFAHDVVATLVKEGTLQPGDVYTWGLDAYPAGEGGDEPAGDDGTLSLEEIAETLPLDVASLAAYLDRAQYAGGRDEPTGQVPVFVPRRVLDEASALSRQAGDVETGGVLVGKLHRDSNAGAPGGPDLFIEVTAQIPAPHTAAAATKITFTSDTWAAVRAAIALRRQDELLAGWWHYHPSFCRLRDCPPERRRECSGSDPFFSAEDVRLHAACFPAGYHVALLVSESGRHERLDHTLFGWSQGMVTARGFHVLGGDDHATSTATERA